MKKYEITIKETNKELSAIERLMVKDFTDAIKLDIACEGNEVLITPEVIAELDVYNEATENKEYTKIVMIDSKGDKYITGSETFRRNLKEIMEVVKSESITDYAIRIFKRDSKNYSGKKFLTCSIAPNKIVD